MEIQPRCKRSPPDPHKYWLKTHSWNTGHQLCSSPKCFFQNNCNFKPSPGKQAARSCNCGALVTFRNKHPFHTKKKQKHCGMFSFHRPHSGTEGEKELGCSRTFKQWRWMEENTTWLSGKAIISGSLASCGTAQRPSVSSHTQLTSLPLGHN